MDNHKELYMDINKFDEDKIIYIKPILFYKVTKNIGIYYKKDIKNKDVKNKETNSKKITSLPAAKRQKIIIQTPKMTVPFGVKEFDNNGRKSYQMCLSFSTLTNLYNEEEIKKFFSFIKKVDTINEETIMDYKSTWGLPKKLVYRKSLKRLSKDFPHYINLPHDEKEGFLFNIYNETAEKSKIDIIEKKSVVSVVMELTDLKFNDNDFRANWTVLQIRKFHPYSPIQEFFMSGCFICDEDNPEDTAYLQMIETYRKKLATPIQLPMIPQLNPNYAQALFSHYPYMYAQSYAHNMHNQSNSDYGGNLSMTDPFVITRSGHPSMTNHPANPHNTQHTQHTQHTQQMQYSVPVSGNQDHRNARDHSHGNVPPPPPPPPPMIPSVPRIIVSVDELQAAKNKLKPLKTTEKTGKTVPMEENIPLEIPKVSKHVSPNSSKPKISKTPKPKTSKAKSANKKLTKYNKPKKQ